MSKRFSSAFYAITAIVWATPTIAYFLWPQFITNTSWLIIAIWIGWGALAVIYGFVFFIKESKHNIKDYKDNKNLVSGVSAIILLAIFFCLILRVTFSLLFKNADEDMKTITDDILKIFFGIVPAIVALLGVHYSISMNDKNRAEDLRLSKKPYFRLLQSPTILAEYEGGHRITTIKSKFRIENISDNIGLPIAISSKDAESTPYIFPYHPLSIKDHIYSEDICIDNVEWTYGVEKLFYYKDTLNNYYYQKLILTSADMHPGKQHEVQVIEDCLLNIKLVPWLFELEHKYLQSEPQKPLAKIQ